MLIIKEKTVGLLQTHCWMGYHAETKEGFIVDPGYSANRIIELAEQSSVKIVAILLTHAHFDHIQALQELREKWNVPVYVGKQEEPLCENPDWNLSGRYCHAPISFTADHYVTDGEVLNLAGFQVKVMETPGHTQGSVCYYIEDEKTLISGDTIFYETYGITSHPTGSQAEVVASVEMLLSTLPDDVAVYPGHGETTTIGHEKDYNPARAEYRMMKGL